MAEQQLFLQNCNGLYCRLISFKHSEEVMGKEIGVRLTETEEKQLRLSCVLFFLSRLQAIKYNLRKQISHKTCSDHAFDELSTLTVKNSRMKAKSI